LDVVELEVGVGVVGEDCLREVEVVDENYQMKVRCSGGLFAG